MSDSAPSFDQLPPEILHRILYHLDVPEILRVRRVSRFLKEISHSREVWSNAYRRAKFVRPPGPFLSQSARDLEDALVPSCRVDRNLRRSTGSFRTERPARRLRTIRYAGTHLHANLVFGRFFFVAFREEVRCYDLNVDALDSNSGASIVHRAIDGTLRSFCCVSAFDVDGRPFACAVLSEVGERMTQISVCLLNVGEESGVTLDLLYQFERSAFDIEAVDLGPRVIVIRGKGPNNDNLIALDVSTRTKFTPLVDMPWHSETARLPVPELDVLEDLTPPTSISTSTHLLFATSFYTSGNGWSTFFQAFSLPPLHDRSPSEFLSPSHGGCVPGINTRDSVLLRDAVLEPSTQDTLITIRVHAYQPSRPRNSLSRHGVLRLSHTFQSDGRDAEVGTVTFQIVGPLGRLSHVPFPHPSFNGTGRLFYTLQPGWCAISALDYNLGTDGDDGGQSEVEVIEYPSILTFTPVHTLLDYDPYSGRICLGSMYNGVEIFDLAV